MLATFHELKEKAVPIKRFTRLIHRICYDGKEIMGIEAFRPNLYLQYSKAFNVECGIVAFVWENVLYIIPETDSVMDILVKDGFVSDTRISVPLAHGEFFESSSEMTSWENLLKLARQGLL